jgi:hypothetical protein
MQKGNFQVKNYAGNFLQKADILLMMVDEVFLNYNTVFNKDYSLQLEIQPW